MPRIYPEFRHLSRREILNREKKDKKIIGYMISYYVFIFVLFIFI